MGLLEKCGRGDCRGAVEFLRELCPDKSACTRTRSPVSRRSTAAYAWIDRLLRAGVPDGRARLILYVISRYLVNVKGLGDEEALAEIDAFLETSCRNYGNCRKIYKSWIRNVLKHVRNGGWKPWSLQRLEREDPELYNIVKSVALGGSDAEKKK